MPLSRKKILIIGSYPTVQAHHGGQKRVQAIVREYEKHFANVKFVAVFSRWANPKYAKTDIPVSHYTDRVIMETARAEDIICGEAIFNEPKVKRRMTQVLTSFRPDIIQIEQVYPYFGLKPLLEELKMSPKLVFDTHNVESKMKPSIYKDAGMKRKDIDLYTKRIADVESDLAKQAALTVAVGPADLEAYDAIGAQRSIVARNGIYQGVNTSASLKTWDKHFAEERINHKLLYVSSAHLPNWTSFLEMVGDGMGFLPPDARILIAGGLSDYLTTRHKWPATPGGATFWCRAEGCGMLSEDQLTGLIASSDAIILPITTGGGSNLKTAEALLSGKPIIATSYAFRAYEKFMELPTVTIADTPDAFRQGLLDATTKQPATLTQAQTDSLQEVAWPQCLSGLIAEVAKL